MAQVLFEALAGISGENNKKYTNIWRILGNVSFKHYMFNILVEYSDCHFSGFGEIAILVADLATWHKSEFCDNSMS